MVEILGKDDPYRKMNTAEKDIRPGFLSSGKGDGSRGGAGDGRVNRDGAADDLRQMESGAEKNTPSQAEDSIAGARQNEESAGGFYRGGISKKKDKGKGKGKGKGIFKRKGPIGLIVALIFGAGGLMGGAQLLQPFSLLEQFRETFNSMHISTNRRSNALLRYQLDSNSVKNPIKSGIFGHDKFKISNSQASKLAKQGIEYDETTFKDVDGKAIGVLKYDDGSGEIKVITATDADAARLNSAGLSKFGTDDIKYDATASSFKDFYDTNDGFYRSYNDGSRTWRGAIANWFGSLTSKFFNNNKLTRNRFKNFDQEVEESGESQRAVATEIMAKNADEIDEGGVKAVAGQETDEIGEDKKPTGNKVIPDSDEIESTPPSTTNRADLDSEAEVNAKLNKISDSYLKDVSGGVSTAVNHTCLIVNFFGGVSLLVSASEALQIINLVTSYFEAIDKVKAGDGANSPIMTLTSALNEPKTSNYTTLEVSGGASSVNDVTSDGISSISTKTITQEKTAMESAGITSLYSNTPININDPSVESFNATSSIKKIFGGLAISMGAFKTCSAAKLLANAVSAALEFWEVVGCIAGVAGAAFTMGATATACTPLIAGLGSKILSSVSMSVLIAGIISVLTPAIAGVLTRNLITNLGGEDLGNALTSGANMYLGNAHRGNGGSLSNRESYVAYALAQQEVIADDARYERMIRDPLDASSKYTFLGTLLTQMMSFMSVSSLFDVVSSTSSAVSSSLVALTPAASAYSIADNIMTEEEYANVCPYLASIGAIGDVYCNPYAVTDMSTIDYDPSEVTNILNDQFLDETTADGNVQIDGDSDLARYIIFCDNRESAFGIADQNIVNKVTDFATVETSNSTFNNVVNSAIGAIPAVGDVIDVVNNGKALSYAGYVSGESCVAGNKAEGANSPDWETAKYYQRFIEDQSLMESMGVIDKSAVTAFLDDYYEQNPLDNSYEGILARYSGLTKDTVIALLDLVDYYNYVANYDPSTRYAFGAPVVEKPEEILFDNENTVAQESSTILLNEITFADVRNRSFAI